MSDCRLCGDKDVSPSVSGPDICGPCDIYPPEVRKVQKELTSALSLLRKERDEWGNKETEQYKAWNEQDDRHLKYEQELQKECDALKREVEELKAHQYLDEDDDRTLANIGLKLVNIVDLESKDAELARLRGALEYIELTGGNCCHDGMNKGVPCPCGACMGNEVAKALGGMNLGEKREGV